MDTNHRSTSRKGNPSGPPTGSAEALVAALAAHPGATAADLAGACGIGRSTATKALALLSADGRVTREQGATEGGRRLADRWVPAPAPDGEAATIDPASSDPADRKDGRLAKGQLAAMVLDYVRANPGDHSPRAVAVALGDRSPGAVANALDKFMGTGEVVETSEKPRRYRADLH